MRLLQIFNQYRSRRGGEERAVFDIMALMEKKGVEAKLLMRTSRGLETTLRGKIHAFASGIYSFSARRDVARVIADFRPDVVHVNNLYPLFSPSVLRACHLAGIPVVMTVHNYGLTCPTMYHLHRGAPCESCLGGREYWCVVKNCRNSHTESVAYALRAFVARKLRLFMDLVTLFIVPTEFTKRLLVRAGFSPDRFVVLRYGVVTDQEPVDAASGTFVGYAGRMSPEKGVDILLRAASQLPDVEFRLAGAGPNLESFVKMAPPNVLFVGLLNEKELRHFYRGARFLVVPSRWYEMCPLVISEAAGHGLPVIVSDLGGLGEIVEDGVTGLTFSPGSEVDLTSKVRYLWETPSLCMEMGQNAHRKALQSLHEEVYFSRLMKVYDAATRLGRGETSII
jgi:glycosyltransferase involved in cell wall biosynthesis